MKESKRKKLEAAGWRVGSADEFLGLPASALPHAVPGAGLGLSAAERRAMPNIKPAPPPPPREDGLRIPEGWKLEPMEREPDHMLLSTPEPMRYMTTIDFRARGLRSGWSTVGRLLGDGQKTPRKKYGGRGWKQQLVDDAVAHLRGVLR